MSDYPYLNGRCLSSRAVAGEAGHALRVRAAQLHKTADAMEFIGDRAAVVSVETREAIVQLREVARELVELAESFEAA